MNDDIIADEEFEGEETLAQKVKQLRDELKEVKTERDQNLAGWQRAKADYVNLERRIREAKMALSEGIVSSFAEDIIPAFDSLEAAIQASTEVPEVLAGLTGLSRQLEDALKKQGVEKYTPQKGDVFNPTLHEPMQTLATNDEKEDNVISETHQSGYRLGERAVRPARVSVYRFEEGA